MAVNLGWILGVCTNVIAKMGSNVTLLQERVQQVVMVAETQKDTCIEGPGADLGVKWVSGRNYEEELKWIFINDIRWI